MKTRLGTLFVVIACIAGDSLADSQRLSNCPGTTPVQQVRRKAVGHGYAFWYQSLVFPVSANQWCHDRAIINDGQPVWVKWNDTVGDVIGEEHLVAGATGVARSVAWEYGQTESFASSIRYGPWEAGPHSESAALYRSMSELRTRATQPGAKDSSLPSMISGFEATVLDPQKQGHIVSITLQSDVLGIRSPYTIKYTVLNRGDEHIVTLVSDLQVGNVKGLSVLWAGLGVNVFTPGVTVSRRGGSADPVFAKDVKEVDIQVAPLRVFLDGRILAGGRVSAYVPGY